MSTADRAVEELIRAEIRREFPGDAFLGEETAAQFSGHAEQHCWVVDPIDGTHNFLRGARYYCVSIAYVGDGPPRDRRRMRPEHDEIFHARRGHGAWRPAAGTKRDRRSAIAQSLRARSCASDTTTGHPSRAISRCASALMDNGVAMRNMGAGALQLAHVSAGRYDALCRAVAQRVGRDGGVAAGGGGRRLRRAISRPAGLARRRRCWRARLASPTPLMQARCDAVNAVLRYFSLGEIAGEERGERVRLHVFAQRRVDLRRRRAFDALRRSCPE